MASKQYDNQRAFKDRERRRQRLGVQPLVCNTGARPKVARGNRVWNALERGLQLGNGAVR